MPATNDPLKTIHCLFKRCVILHYLVNDVASQNWVVIRLCRGLETVGFGNDVTYNAIFWHFDLRVISDGRTTIVPIRWRPGEKADGLFYIG